MVLRDRAVSAGMAFLHDHGGKLHDVGRAAAHARTGGPLSGLADSASRHNLPPHTHAVLHLVSTTVMAVRPFLQSSF